MPHGVTWRYERPSTREKSPPNAAASVSGEYLTTGKPLHVGFSGGNTMQSLGKDIRKILDDIPASAWPSDDLYENAPFLW